MRLKTTCYAGGETESYKKNHLSTTMEVSKTLLQERKGDFMAKKFIECTDGVEPLTEMDMDFMLKTLDHINVFEDVTLLVVFLDGMEIECKNEEE